VVIHRAQRARSASGRSLVDFGSTDFVSSACSLAQLAHLAILATASMFASLEA